MGPFRVLGIDEDADERAVRRAYAQRLKVTRPDDDAEAFQRLNEAYREALDRVRWRAVEETPEEEPGLVEAVVEAHASERSDAMAHVALLPAIDTVAPVGHAAGDEEGAPEPDTDRTFDVGAFLDAFAERASTADGDGLRAWLEGEPALYDLELKDIVGHHLVAVLWDHDFPALLTDEQMEVVEQFFAIDTGAGLRDAMRARRAVCEEDTRAYDEFGPMAIRQLKRRFSLPQSICMSLMPGVPRRLAMLARRLEQDAGELPEGVNPRQAEFFAAITGHRMTRELGWTIAARAMAWAGLVAALAGVVLGMHVDGTQWALLFIAAAATVVAGHALWVARLRLDAGALRTGAQGYWLPGLAVALAGVAGIAVSAGAHAAVAWIAALIALPLALRHFAQSFDLFRFCIGGYFICWMLPTADRLAAALAFGLAAFVTCDAVFAWRHRLPFAASRGNVWTTRASFAVFIGALLWRTTGLA
jgi:hypothetical protein